MTDRFECGNGFRVVPRLAVIAGQRPLHVGIVGRAALGHFQIVAGLVHLLKLLVRKRKQQFRARIGAQLFRLAQPFQRVVVIAGAHVDFAQQQYVVAALGIGGDDLASEAARRRWCGPSGCSPAPRRIARRASREPGEGRDCKHRAKAGSARRAVPHIQAGTRVADRSAPLARRAAHNPRPGSCRRAAMRHLRGARQARVLDVRAPAQ